MFLGDMMMEGLGQGLEASGKEVIKDAELINKDLLSEFDGLNSDLAKLPTDYNINSNIPSVVPASQNAVASGGSANGVTIELRIDNFNNYSSEDIASLTEEVLTTANAFMVRKGMAY